jgi:hypothetical protein
MKMLTYRQLKAFLNKLKDEQLDQNVAVYDDEVYETYPARGVYISKDSDVLDDGHAYIFLGR